MSVYLSMGSIKEMWAHSLALLLFILQVNLLSNVYGIKM